MKEFLINAGGLLSFGAMVWFGVKVWRGKAEPTSMASWLMWVILDAVILGSTIATHKPCALALSYVAGASFVFIVHIKKGKWVWTYVETISAGGTAVSTILWFTLSPEAGVIAGIVAMTAAGMPMLLSFAKAPDRQAFWLFANVTIACAMTLIATWPWTIGGSLLSGGGLLYNGLVAYLATRDQRPLVA